MKVIGLALVGFILSGCATPGGVQDRLASRMYLVGHDVGTEEREPRVVQALELPLAGELYLFPRWLQIHAPDAAFGEPIRLQTSLRIVRKDGSVIHWWLGSERSAPAGEGGRSINPESFAAGSTTLSFGTVRLGPLRLEGVVGMEVLVAELSGPTDPTRPRLTGAAALARAPLVGSADAEALQHAAEVTSRAGGALRLAANVPVVDKPAAPGQKHLEFLVVGQEGDGRWPDELDPADPDRLSPWVQFASEGWRLVLSLGVQVDVPDHDRKGAERGADHAKEP